MISRGAYGGRTMREQREGGNYVVVFYEKIMGGEKIGKVTCKKS